MGTGFPRKPHSPHPRECGWSPGDLVSLSGFATNELGHVKFSPPAEPQFTPVSDDHIAGPDEIFPKCELIPWMG